MLKESTPPTPEIEESRSRSFVDAWQAAQDYAIVGGVIVPSGGPKEPYLPMGRPELPGEFAALDGAPEEKVLSFVRRYGLLGYGNAFRFLEQVGAAELKLHDPDCPGDPLAWVLAHAGAVRVVMRLAAVLDDPVELRVRLEQLTARSDVQNSAVKTLSFRIPERGHHFPSDYQVAWASTPRETALKIIAAVLNKNLTGITRHVHVEYQPSSDSLGFTSVFEPCNLLDCIYWMVSEAVLGHRVRSCALEGCGRVFVAVDDRTKYCPPLLWESISSCMNRAKQRRFRDKK